MHGEMFTKKLRWNQNTGSCTTFKNAK